MALTGTAPRPAPPVPLTPGGGSGEQVIPGTSSGIPQPGSGLATSMAPVQYNIANLSQPQLQSASTTAPAATMAQNAANAQANQRALQTFFGTGSGFAPQYEVDYSQVAQVANAGASQNGVRSGAAGNPT